MASVGVSQAAAPRVEDGIEAGHKRVGRHVSDQGVVDPSQDISRRVFRGSGYGPEHAAGAGHHKRCGYALARSVPHYEAKASVREEVEVVEVTAYLPSGLVEGRDL